MKGFIEKLCNSKYITFIGADNIKNNLVAISIFFSAICFVFGSWLISNGLENNTTKPINTVLEKQLFTQTEVSDFLGITIEEILKLTKVQDGSNGYTSEIPFIEIDNVVYYPKKAIDNGCLIRGL